jgi:hypothetical protein
MTWIEFIQDVTFIFVFFPTLVHRVNLLRKIHASPFELLRDILTVLSKDDLRDMYTEGYHSTLSDELKS